jgi:hypothetical protein
MRRGRHAKNPIGASRFRRSAGHNVDTSQLHSYERLSNFSLRFMPNLCRSQSLTRYRSPRDSFCFVLFRGQGEKELETAGDRFCYTTKVD